MEQRDWKTTITGIIGGVAAIITAIWPKLEPVSGAFTAISGTIAGVAVMLIGVFAKDKKSDGQ